MKIEFCRSRNLRKILADKFRERLTLSFYEITYNTNKKVSRGTNYCNVLMEQQTFEIFGLRWWEKEFLRSRNNEVLEKTTLYGGAKIHVAV